MVIGTYIEWHSFLCRLRDWRCAIERLGVGRHLLSSFPIILYKPPARAFLRTYLRGAPS
jgi:hypothetical protein